MPEYLATTPGLYPLPDWAKRDLSRLKGHQKHDLVSGDEPPAVETVYDDARDEVITNQHDADLDLIVEGQLRWDDMLAHPLCVHPNVDTRGLVRYYDNNNFYRDPVITGDLTPHGDLARDLDHATTNTDSLNAVIPGPYTLADLATDNHYGNPDRFLDAIAQFLAAETDAFPPHHTLTLLEPSLTTNPPSPTRLDAVQTAIDTVAEPTDAPVIAQTYWAPITPAVHETLLDTRIDAIGYDLVTSPDDNLAVVRDQGTTPAVALAIVDGQNTQVEPPTTVRDRITAFENATPGTPPDTVYLTANTELFYLPVTKFKEKLTAIANATPTEVTP